MSEEPHSWIESSDVLSTFPTLVWKLQLKAALREAMDARILGLIDGLRGGARLARGEGWQSQQDLHRMEKFHELVSCVHRVTCGILRFLKIGYEDFEISGCWANVLAPRAAHRMHNHPNNFLSGVYYLRTGPGADTINFHDPRAQAAVIRPPVTELTAANTDQVVVRVTNGMLLMFPAYLQHSVDANASETERISVSFNVMFSAFTENLSRPLW
jgi:uncharacterized protein (TIGR02466 family)